MSDDCVFKNVNSAPDNKSILDNASDKTIVLVGNTDVPEVTPKPTPTPTPTTTKTNTPTATQTSTNTRTATQTPTQTSSPTKTPTTTPTRAIPPTATPTSTTSSPAVVPSPSLSATSTPQSTSTPTSSPTQTGTPTKTPLPTPTTTSTATATPTPTTTVTATVTPSGTPPSTPTASPNTPTPQPSSSVPATPTKTPKPTETPQPSPIPPEDPVPECESTIIEVLDDGTEVILDPNSVFGAGEICCVVDCGDGGGGGGGEGEEPGDGGGNVDPGDGGGGLGGGDEGDGGGGFGGPLIPGGGGGGNGPAGGGDPNGNCASKFKKQIIIPNNITNCAKYWASFNNILKQKAIEEWNDAPFYKNAAGKKVPLEDHPTQKNKDCWDPNPIKKFTRSEGAICGGKCYYKYWYEARPRLKQMVGCVTPTPTPTKTPAVCEPICIEVHAPQPRCQFGAISNCEVIERFSTTINVPEGMTLPVYVTMTGGADDVLMINGEVVEAGQYIDPTYGCYVGAGNYSFVLHDPSFTIGAGDTVGFCSGYDYTICFSPCIPPQTT